MFLSLVRPERISSPITSSAAVTGSLGAGEFAVGMAARVLAAGRSGPSLPCHCGGKCSLSLLRTCDGLGFNSGPYLARGRVRQNRGGRWGDAGTRNATDEGIVADALLRCTLSLDGSRARRFLYCAVGIHRAAGICPGIIQGGAIARAREVSMGASDINHPVGTLRAR